MTHLDQDSPNLTSPDLTSPDLLRRIETYYDAAPRSGARTEGFDGLTLFVREGTGGPYYARPALGWTGPVSVADVDRVRARQRELGVPEAFEWVHETTPGLRAAVEASGLTVHEHPLMVHDPAVAAAFRAELPLSDGRRATVRVLGPQDAVLASALGAVWAAFGEPGTAVGAAGAEEVAAQALARTADGTVERTAGRITAGYTAVAAAVADGQALGAGQHNPVGQVSEIVGVGTLPSARRQGLGQAVTGALLADARSKGVGTVFLTASDEDVARVYARLGFRRIATALIAEPAA